MGAYLSKQKFELIDNVIEILLENRKIAISLLCAGTIIGKLLTDRLANLPPGPLNLPYLNAGWRLFFYPRADVSLSSLNNEYKSDIVSCRFFSSPIIIVINSPRLIKELFKKNATTFSDRDSLKRMQGSLSGEEFSDVIFSLNYGDKFLQAKKFILRSFYQDNHDMLRHTLDFQCDQFIANVKKFDGSTLTNLKPMLSTSLARIICSFTISIDSSINDEDLNEFLRITNDFNNGFGTVGSFVPNPYPWLWRKIFYSSIDIKFRKCIREYRGFLRKFVNMYEKIDSDSRGTSLLAELLNNKTIDKGNELLDTLLMMTIDNPTSICEAFMWLFLYLASYQDVQEKARKLIAELTNNTRKITIEDRAKLPYFSALIYETFRCCNLQPFSPVHHVKEGLKFQGYNIPKGSIVLTNYTAMNKDPNVFPDPEKFNPERFLNEDGSFKPVDSLTPWGFGPRSCPGERLSKMELFLIVARVLQNFRLAFPDNYNPDLTPIFDSFCVPGPFPIRFIPITE
ncbi:unnamed protein product [Dimorphilus gyrociliatus]|uniref:Uncharacterized protein n=1 Tax=Dimorphilus gyrociliatus TaxID=2664684 RepID=A0A7I8W8E9_9ANNE|nr:unnamed protein product [Dimorphilus gyrociliatus]